MTDAASPALSPEGTHAFLAELLSAVMESKERADLRPVQIIIESWYRSLLIVQHPDWQEWMAAAGEEAMEAPLTLDQVKEQLGL